MVRVTVLNENTAGKRGMLAEHGLSLLVETSGGAGDRRWLFDTGQTDVFLKNADRLGADLHHLDGIILSHGHFDHCGGLQHLARRCRSAGVPLPPVYVRERAFLKKTAVNSDRITYRVIGIPWERELIASAIRLTGDREAVGEQTWVLGNIPYTVEFEKRPDLFFIDEGERKVPDFMDDEQMLLLETEEGLVIFAGCCHAGIVNCLEYVKKSFPGRRLHAVFAGMHLSGAGKARLEKTVEALGKETFDCLIPAHCTGLEAIGRMKAAFGDRCLLAETGKTMIF